MNKESIREIKDEDNAQIASVIKEVLTEFGFSKGSSAEDPQLNQLSHFYREHHGNYFVISDMQGRIYGGGGYARLAGSSESENVCELQKFYFLPALRGRSFGKELLYQLLKSAISSGYKTAYLETASVLERSIKLYELFGFVKCDAKGDSGHRGVCDINMTLMLDHVEIDKRFSSLISKSAGNRCTISK